MCSDAAPSASPAGAAGEAARLREQLENREAQLQQQGQELIRMQGALEEARFNETSLRFRVERTEAQLREAQLELKEAVRVAGNMRFWVQNLAEDAEDAPPSPRLMPCGPDAGSASMAKGLGGVARADGLGPRAAPAELEASNGPECAACADGPSHRAGLGGLQALESVAQTLADPCAKPESRQGPDGERPRLESQPSNLSLTAELDILELQMNAIASQNQALEQEMSRPKDEPAALGDASPKSFLDPAEKREVSPPKGPPASARYAMPKTLLEACSSFPEQARTSAVAPQGRAAEREPGPPRGLPAAASSAWPPTILEASSSSSEWARPSATAPQDPAAGAVRRLPKGMPAAASNSSSTAFRKACSNFAERARCLARGDGQVA